MPIFKRVCCFTSILFGGCLFIVVGVFQFLEQNVWGVQQKVLILSSVRLNHCEGCDAGLTHLYIHMSTSSLVFISAPHHNLPNLLQILKTMTHRHTCLEKTLHPLPVCLRSHTYATLLWSFSFVAKTNSQRTLQLYSSTEYLCPHFSLALIIIPPNSFSPNMMEIHLNRNQKHHLWSQIHHNPRLKRTSCRKFLKFPYYDNYLRASLMTERLQTTHINYHDHQWHNNGLQNLRSWYSNQSNNSNKVFLLVLMISDR